MRTKIYKAFFIWNFEKEEVWLNEMAAKGWALVAVGFCNYTFEECVPGEYNVRLELLEKQPEFPESISYIDFLEDTGAQYLGSVFRWAYFRRPAELGSFDLYSDNPSRIRHLNRMLWIAVPVTILNLNAALLNLSLALGKSTDVNLVCFFISTAMTALCGYGFFRILAKKLKLKKQRVLFE